MKLCECGCGQPAPIAKQSDTRLGYIKDGPKRFVAGHQSRVRFAPPEERFWAQVDKNGPIHPALGTACWLWTGVRDKDGYGVIYANGKTKKAHRFSFELRKGPIPAGQCVLHDCDTPSCVRPDHTYAGTAIDNARDCNARGRRPVGDRNGSRIHPEKRQRGDRHWTRQVTDMPTKGERNGNAKLSAEDVRAIRRLYAAGEQSQSAIGETFGIAQTYVGKIVNRLNWKHVE